VKTEPKLPDLTNVGVSNFKDYELFDKCRGPLCYLLQTYEDHDKSKQATYRAIGAAFRMSENDKVQGVSINERSPSPKRAPPKRRCQFTFEKNANMAPITTKSPATQKKTNACVASSMGYARRRDL